MPMTLSDTPKISAVIALRALVYLVFETIVRRFQIGVRIVARPFVYLWDRLGARENEKEADARCRLEAQVAALTAAKDDFAYRHHQSDGKLQAAQHRVAGLQASLQDALDMVRRQGIGLDAAGETISRVLGTMRIAGQEIGLPIHLGPCDLASAVVAVLLRRGEEIESLRSSNARFESENMRLHVKSIKTKAKQVRVARAVKSRKSALDVTNRRSDVRKP